MEIKKIAVVTVLCLVAILLGAVAAYGYIEVSRLGNHVSDLESQVESLQETVSSLEAERDSLQSNITDLESQVDELQSEIDHLKNELSHVNSTKTFVFEWSPHVQNVTDETLRMEITFTVEGGNLSIVAKINDDEVDYWDYLGVVIDFDNDGRVEDEGAGMLFADNTTTPAILGDDGGLIPAIWPREPSEHHTCIFEPGVGYTFNAWLPIVHWDDFGVPHYAFGDLVHICYKDGADGFVYVRFHVGIPLEAS